MRLTSMTALLEKLSIKHIYETQNSTLIFFIDAFAVLLRRFRAGRVDGAQFNGDCSDGRLYASHYACGQCHLRS